MFIHITTRTQISQGPTIPFTCPRCQNENSGDVIETVQRGKLYGLIPVITLRNTFITCPACTKKSAIALPLDKLRQLPPDLVAALVLRGPPKTAMWLAIAGVLLMLVPLVGMALAATSLYLGRGNVGWVRALGWMGFIVNFALTGCILMLGFIR